MNHRSQAVFSLSLLVAFLGLLSLESCTPAKKLTYFQSENGRQDTLLIMQPYVPTIKKGDVIAIQVSSLNPEASAYFNPAAVAEAGTSITPANPLARTPGYLVDADGTVKLPLIGQVLVAGLPNNEAAEVIRGKLAPYLKEPTVNVRNLNFKVSVLGEVTRPALFTIPNEQITLPEALGLAGDLTIYGRRDNVLIIREVGDKRVFARLDLTRRDAFQSPYYSLHPNDVVYVEPGKARVTSVDRTYQLAPVALSLLSLLAIIATRR